MGIRTYLTYLRFAVMQWISSLHLDISTIWEVSFCCTLDKKSLEYISREDPDSAIRTEDRDGFSHEA